MSKTMAVKKEGEEKVYTTKAEATGIKDTICKVVLVGLFVFSGLVAQEVYSCYYERIEANPEPYAEGRKPVLEDLKVMAVAAIILSVIRAFSYEYILFPMAKVALERVKPKATTDWSVDLRAEKEYKWATSSFKFIYMVGSSIGGYYLLRNEDWLCPSLGGKGVGLLYPSGDVEISYELKMFYMIEMGYAVHSLGLHLYTTPTNDFWEMLLHHIATVLLEFISYMSGSFRIGCLVLLVHDVPDIFVYFTKACVDGASVPVLLTGYAGMVSSWGFFRLYVFPKEIISKAFEMYYAKDYCGCAPMAASFLIFMLTLLLVLHVWWYYLFFKIIRHFTRTGKGHDLVAKTKADELELVKETKELKKTK
eukprot:m.16836 g.16836  ORF g.16836 m.16836 type:complete len:364 (+) comp5819_c1_seq1:153-1244(+)